MKRLNGFLLAGGLLMAVSAQAQDRNSANQTVVFGVQPRISPISAGNLHIESSRLKVTFSSFASTAAAHRSVNSQDISRPENLLAIAALKPQRSDDKVVVTISSK